MSRAPVNNCFLFVCFLFVCCCFFLFSFFVFVFVYYYYYFLYQTVFFKNDNWRVYGVVPFIINERKCANCSVLEDEFHFALECLLYSVFRKK